MIGKFVEHFGAHVWGEKRPDSIGQFGVGDAGEVALHGTDGSAAGAIQRGCVEVVKMRKVVGEVGQYAVSGIHIVAADGALAFGHLLDSMSIQIRARLEIIP